MAAVNRLGFMGGRRGRETTRTREDLFVALSSHTRTHTHTHTRALLTADRTQQNQKKIVTVSLVVFKI